jgi:hypothetical protein
VSSGSVRVSVPTLESVTDESVVVARPVSPEPLASVRPVDGPSVESGSSPEAHAIAPHVESTSAHRSIACMVEKDDETPDEYKRPSA